MVVTFDPGEDRDPEFLSRVPAPGVEDVLLQECEEGLHGGVVTCRTDTAHGAVQAVLPEDGGERFGAELIRFNRSLQHRLVVPTVVVR